MGSPQAQLSAASVPIFGTDGEIHLVPNTDLPEAMKNGGQLAVPMRSPAGDARWVPASQVQAAQSNHGKVDWSIVPQEHKEGAIAAFGKDILGAGAGFANLIKEGFSGNPAALAVEMGVRTGVNDMMRATEGRSKPYRVAAGIAENVTPANIRGMEEAANEGDATGVLGHAAAGAALATGPSVAAKVAPGVVDTVGSAAKSAAPIARKVTATALDVGPKLLKPREYIIGVMQRMAENLRNGKPVHEGVQDLQVPEEGSYPVTTPSDVPLEHIPEEAPTALEQKLQYFADKGDPKAAAQLQQIQAAKPKIRATAEAARSKRTSADFLDDKAAAETARMDYENAGRSAYRQAREEFAANNSMDKPKWQRQAEFQAAQVLEDAQKKVQQIMDEAQSSATFNGMRGLKSAAGKTPTPPTDDLTPLLEQSLADAVARKKAGK